MARPNPKKYWLLKRIILASAFLGLGYYVFLAGYAKPNLSWERLYWLSLSLFVLSGGLALITTKSAFLANTSRIFVGLVFVYSGFVKVVDPLGSTYKFLDYFEAWHFSFMDPYALPLSLLLSVSELVVGAALLFNVFARLASLGALIFMVYFTPVTLYLSLQQLISGKELVHDCGCFGDAFILSNWQTFIKNIILFVPTYYMFKKRKEFESIFMSHIQGLFVAFFVVLSTGIGYWGLEHLPLIDFRPFKIGSNIPANMAIPPGAPQARYDTFLEYKEKKTGVKKMFTLQNYPQDTLWEFVDSKNVLIQEGYVPPIHDFTISNATEGDITAVVLDDKNYHFLLVAYALDKAETDNMSRINTLFNWCQRKGVAMRCLTSSVDTEIETFKKETHARFPFYSTDPTTLKTMIRANPGLMLIKNGTVIDMWHSNDIPDVEYFEKRLNK